MKITLVNNPNVSVAEAGQDEAVIAASSTKLFTYGLVTCSALYMCDENTHLLAHADAGTNSEILADAIQQHLNLESPALKTYIIPGAEKEDSFFSTEYSEEAISLALLSIKPKPTYTRNESYTCTSDMIVAHNRNYCFHEYSGALITAAEDLDLTLPQL